MDDFRRILERRGAWDPGACSGRIYCEEDRRTVVGGERDRRAEAGIWGGEGVLMDAELEVSGDCIDGRLGAMNFQLCSRFRVALR
jgi:hypothetical protein